MQRADDAVAGRGEVAKDHVPALLAAEIQVLPHHFLDHVAVADFRPDDLAAMRRERFVEPEVAHHRGDEGVLSQLSAAQQIDRGDGENFVAIHDLALLVAKQDAIGVAVVRDPDHGAAFPDESLNFLRVNAAALGVDVGSVGLVVRDGQFRSELAQDAGGRFVGGAVRDIDRDAHFLERHPARKTGFRKLDVAAERVIDPGGAADLLRGRPDGIDLTREDELLDLAARFHRRACSRRAGRI